MLGFKFCQLVWKGGFKEMKFFSLIPGLNLDLIHKSRKKRPAGAALLSAGYKKLLINKSI